MTVRGTSPLAAYAHKGRYPSVGAGRAEALTGWSPMTEVTFFPPSGSGKVWSEDLSFPFPMARFPCFPEGRPLPPYRGLVSTLSPKGYRLRLALAQRLLIPRRVQVGALPVVWISGFARRLAVPPHRGSDRANPFLTSLTS